MPRTLLYIALGLALSACSEDLSERFLECAEMVKEARQKEEIDKSLECFTPKSRAILSELIAQRKVTGGVLNYMRDYRKLLDYDTVVGAPDFVGNLAILVVSKGKRDVTTITFERVDEEWVIDAMELPRFWRPLDQALAGEF